jgi:uncharacterized membrane protein (DUF2068 family)
VGLLSRLDFETWVCSVKGHVTPAATVAALEEADRGAVLGIDVDPQWRLSRCLRCDAWVAGAPPAEPEFDRLPPLEQLRLPRRGAELRQAIVLRVIAVERGIHSVGFALVAALGLLLKADLVTVQSTARRIVDSLSGAEAEAGRPTNHGILVRESAKVLHLRASTLNVLIAAAIAYAVIEGVEAVGLWRERRWAEYLTALATAGFLPLEVHELLRRVTVLRVSALVVNVAILVYLVYAKRLFGVARRRSKARQAAAVDLAELFRRPGGARLDAPGADGAGGITVSPEVVVVHETRG